MTDVDFWERAKHGADKLNIPADTFYMWKHRGRVSRNHAIELYQVLAGTEHEITLDELKQRHI